ncbi:hypothetical protein E2562_027860 [Oryza meyeriana var. granulata]|uniref:Secreted protein n=1 Tax=Oryza meyeriana var. granulata TaxID=110450 RepID=A0A6G1DN94_9ORYZ|nr:hypothetical protein E2562_027860 [Oryza meyeriana var. granulata]
MIPSSWVVAAAAPSLAAKVTLPGLVTVAVPSEAKVALPAAATKAASTFVSMPTTSTVKAIAAGLGSLEIGSSVAVHLVPCRRSIRSNSETVQGVAKADEDSLVTFGTLSNVFV